MKTSMLILGVTGLSMVCSLAHAQSRMKAGQWEITSQMTVTGMPFSPPPQKTQVCVTPEDAARNAPPKPVADDSGCSMQNLKQDASGVSADLQCTGKMKGSGRFEVKYTDSAHYSGTMNFNGDFGGHAAQMQQTYSGVWLKDSCK